jgi:hypothetical protein
MKDVCILVMSDASDVAPMSLLPLAICPACELPPERYHASPSDLMRRNGGLAPRQRSYRAGKHGSRLTR